MRARVDLDHFSGHHVAKFDHAYRHTGDIIGATGFSQRDTLRVFVAKFFVVGRIGKTRRVPASVNQSGANRVDSDTWREAAGQCERQRVERAFRGHVGIARANATDAGHGRDHHDHAALGF